MVTASELASLKTYRTSLVTALASLTIKPSYSVDGQSVSHDQHRQSLIKEIADLDSLINSLEGPVESTYRGVV